MVQDEVMPILFNSEVYGVVWICLYKVMISIVINQIVRTVG